MAAGDRRTSGTYLRVDTQALHAALDASRASRSLTWQQVAREMSATLPVSGVMLTGLSRGGRVTIDVALTLAGWLGRTVAPAPPVAEDGRLGDPRDVDERGRAGRLGHDRVPVDGEPVVRHARTDATAAGALQRRAGRRHPRHRTADRRNTRTDRAVMATANATTTARLSAAIAVGSLMPQMSWRPCPDRSTMP